MISEFSICIISYNAEDVIAALLQQIQDAADFAKLRYEILVVDNNSGDRTPEIIRQYQHKDVVYILNSDVGNVSRSRNLALKSARYKYCWFFDDDSIVDPELFKRARPVLDGCNADVVVPMVMNTNGIVHNCQRGHNRRDLALISDGAKFLRPCSSSFLINTESVRGGEAYFDEKIRFVFEDAEYFFRLERNGRKILYLNTICIGHRVKKVCNGAEERFYLLIRNAFYFQKTLSKEQRQYVKYYLVSGSLMISMFAFFLVALFNYNIWEDFYNPDIRTIWDRVRNLFNPKRTGLGRSSLHSLYYFFKGVFHGVLAL